MTHAIAEPPIYLDYAATTPVDPSVLACMMDALSYEGTFGNPASSHVFGAKALEHVETARQQIARLINTVPRNLIFTSGATEANNLAIKGAAQLYQSRGRHLITVQTEHKSVLDVYAVLEKEGFSVTYLKPKANGLIDIDNLKAACRSDTVLVSIMHVNNETGVLQDIAQIGDLTRSLGILLHVDAAQSLGKVVIDLQTLAVDLMSFSAHKVYGPKGIGALYVNDQPRVRLAAQIHGGQQERRLRAGTLATHQIVGFGQACEVLHQNHLNEIQTISQYRDQFWAGISNLPGVSLNTDLACSVPHILNVRFNRSLLDDLPSLAVSNGAACNTFSVEPSYVLQAMGLTPGEAKASLRFSFGRFTTALDIESAINRIRRVFHVNGS